MRLQSEFRVSPSQADYLKVQTKTFFGAFSSRLARVEGKRSTHARPPPEPTTIKKGFLTKLLVVKIPALEDIICHTDIITKYNKPSRETSESIIADC
jgi:hypothetical protein